MVVEEILTNPGTFSEWVWFVVAVIFVVIVALGGGTNLVMLVSAQVTKAQARAKKLNAEAERFFNAVAPAGSPQQQYIHSQAVAFTKLDLVKLLEKVTKQDIPPDGEDRLRAIERAVDAYVLELTDGADKNVMEAMPKGG